MASVSADLDRGRRIGKYEILTRLSMGGMAELFLAYTAGPGGFRKFVAVKQILPDIKKDESFVKMFLDEARITAAFSNANIGQVFDLGEEDGELYLAMEFISGQNLEQIVKRAAKKMEPLPVGFSARVVRDACLGLHYAHHFTDPSGKPAPVVHRDVSPKNVMVTYTGDVKVIDFGIAKARGRLNRTQVGIVKGTSGYMSPEQVRNEPLDGRTDLFAAGVMLHELTTYSRLFTAPNDTQMMMKIVEGEIQQPRNLNPKVPKELSDVVMRALSRKRDGRFTSGKEMARAIEQACPEMFDEDALAEVMSGLFDDKIQTTRSLLELANTDDTGKMTKAVEALNIADEAQEATPKRRAPSKKVSQPLGAAARQSPSRKLPTVRDEDERDQTLPPRVPKKGTAGADRYQSKVGRDYAMYEGSDVETDTAKTQDPDKRKDTQDLPALPARRGERAPEKKEGGAGGVIFLVLLVAVLGGLLWAGWSGPLKDSGVAVAARTWLEHELNGEPPAPPPASLDQVKPSGPKPQWLVEKEAQDERLRAEAARQKEIEDAANDPENKKILETLDAQIKELDKHEAELRQMKIEAKQSGQATNARIEALERQISDQKKAIEDLQGRKGRKPRAQANADGVEVVRDQKSAKKAEVGYLTLYTVNPSKAAVFEQETALGTTPLQRVPLDEGSHTLRIVDGDSQNRTLTVTVKAGQVTELKGLDVSSMTLSK
jgi:serine/threonine protein kinase, bacterial